MNTALPGIRIPAMVPDKFLNRLNEFWILLVFLNFLHQFVKIDFFPFHFTDNNVKEVYKFFDKKIRNKSRR